MNKTTLSSLAAAAALAASIGFAAAQSATTSTTTTWSNDEGATIREYSTTKKYEPIQDPSVQVQVGTELPRTVELHPLPETMNVPERERYSYTIVNNHPVVVERSTRRVVHSWDE